jgi:hypothetical protein
MTTTNARLLLWAPRVLGVALCLFLGLFALDAFQAGEPLWRNVAGFLIHLIPSFLVLALTVVSWRREWIGGFAFLALAAVYAVMVRFRLDWVLVISGPLLIVGLLFLWSWRHHGDLQAG